MKEANPMPKSRRCCSLCHQPGHRADRCPQGASAGGSPEAPPRSDPRAAERAVAQLIEVAMELGRTQGLIATQEATGELLGRLRQMRLALVKSRSANSKLRAHLADQAEAKMLARLDRDEGARTAAKTDEG